MGNYSAPVLLPNHQLSTNTGDSGTLYPPSIQTISATYGGSNGVNYYLMCLDPVSAAATTRVYLSSANLAVCVNSFVGFAQGTATVGNTVTIATVGHDDNQSGLTIGAQYYLANTSGTLGTSAGTVTRKVGIAISATSILITNIW